MLLFNFVNFGRVEEVMLPVGEAFVADGAFEGPLARVQPEVTLEDPGSVELLAAVDTLV